MTVESTEVTEQWEPTRRRTTEVVEKAVRLSDASAITARGGPCVPYTIRFVFTRFSHSGPWHARVTIYAKRKGRMEGDSFGPDQVYRPPSWLTDLIAGATPDEGALTHGQL